MLQLDATTSSLDHANQIDILETIKGLTVKGILAFMTIHDLNLSLRYCDRSVLLKEGGDRGRGEHRKHFQRGSG
ncbi:MAG: hypothetical protein JXA22_04105 [Candidatus Thermoplasmatota archaeon]|nr:hypothetical protein [Candidatus Thermoplasmatota archaeon]